MCSRTGVSIWQGDSHAAAESHANVLCKAVKGPAIHQNSQMVRNHLEQLQKIPIDLHGQVYQRVKSILERNFVKYESPAVYPERVISGILRLQRYEVLLQNMITSHRISLLESMTDTMKIPLDSYEDFLCVQERLDIYYIMLERSLRLSCGQHDIE